MAEHAAADPLPAQICSHSDPEFLDLHVFPDAFYSHGCGLAAETDLDLDFDGIDWDISVDDFLLPDVPLPLSNPSHPLDDGSPPESGVSTTSCSPATSGNLNVRSPDSGHSVNCSDSCGVVKQEEKSGWGTKRKKERDELSGSSNGNPRSRKFRRSEDVNSRVFTAGSEEEEKRKARLMRNRESAQLSRQRKKNYIEELEEKIRSMQSTITELNSKISFIMAENSSLKQQLGGGPPPPVTSMNFPWIPYPGLAFRPQGSLVPLVPIPRLRSQHAAATQKSKKTVRKSAESKNRKVASITFLGLLLFMLTYGGIVERVHNRYKEIQYFGTGTTKDGMLGNPNGMVLSVTGRSKSLGSVVDAGFNIGNMSKGEGGLKSQNGKLRSEEPWSPDHPKFTQNSTESIPALLYVSRNGKHVKIDGNLIINSVLASEKAMAQVNSTNQPKQPSGTVETGLAIARYLPSGLSLSASDIVDRAKSYGTSIEHQRALGSDSEDKFIGTSHDGPLQKWFREGLEGPIFSSGTCTEVFQFEISPSSSAAPSAIVTAPSPANKTDTPHSSSSTHAKELKNRRFLYPQAIPLPGSTLNRTEHIGNAADGNNASALPPMIVSVLADPREVADADVDGMISSPNKQLPRIFVVVLLDSVKYVTYSCVLPFKNPTHLVN